ncbi:hypothetical protein BV898_07707 [Hypsibius exemplaris]|uniref:Uncharacterized protein n=1 Tax=Hypsibius exemplaris TaxID=2072580 RepID=A0A1W0WSF5_HYPEX|nr:hypothetical protein BV898_07707 [Hypsibius exemplaris]
MGDGQITAKPTGTDLNWDEQMDGQLTTSFMRVGRNRPSPNTTETRRRFQIPPTACGGRNRALPLKSCGASRAPPSGRKSPVPLHSRTYHLTRPKYRCTSKLAAHDTREPRTLGRADASRKLDR